MNDKINSDEFVADVFSVIGGMGMWPQFVRAMEELGYTEDNITTQFEVADEKAGRG